jgi:predicted nucleotidyltransferase
MKPIYVTIVGSRLYGINHEDSDTDIKGIGFSSIDKYLGLNFSELKPVEYTNNLLGGESINGSVFDVRKAIALLLKGNPTILEPFMVDDKFIIHNSDIGKKIVSFVKNNMISKHFFNPYFGYHYSQIKEFTNSQREGKRKQLFDTYGFDGKFAGHAYRLAKQCVELMKTGTLNPTLRGHDIDIVMNMRNYVYTKEECLSYLNNNINEMNEALNQSTLPDSIDFEKVNGFVISILDDYIKNGVECEKFSL